MHEAVVACRLIQWVAEEMGMSVEWPFLTNTDSPQAHSFQHSTCPNSKVRGCFDLRNKRTTELRDKGVVSSKKTPQDLNVADMLTHCFARKQFQHRVFVITTLRGHVYSISYTLLELFNNNNIKHTHD